MTKRRIPFTFLAATAWACAGAGAQTAADPSRGQLLYATHCNGCHTSQLHWRDDKVVTDWGSLIAQVRRWQARELLNWNEADIAQVARHLNDTIYRFAQPPDRVGRVAEPAAGLARQLPAAAARPVTAKPATTASMPGVL